MCPRQRLRDDPPTRGCCRRSAMAGIGEVSLPSRPRLALAPHARERAPSRGACRRDLKRCRHGHARLRDPTAAASPANPKQPSFRTIGRGTGSVDANAPAISCEPALRPCGCPAPTWKMWTTAADYGVTTAFTFRVAASVPRTTPFVGSGQQRFSFGKNETRGIPCRSMITTLRRAGGLLERPQRRKNLELDTLGLEPL
jgi:hypothetical protein